MKNKFLLCFFLFLPIFIYSLEPPENPKNVIKAKKLIEKNCSSCHTNQSSEIPSLEDLSLWSEEALYFSMDSGKMKPMSTNLSKEEKKLIASTISNVNTSDLKDTPAICSNKLNEIDLLTGSDWTGWGNGAFNKRKQDNTSININNVTKLKLKWSFALEGGNSRSQPIIIGDLLLIPSSRTLYALDKRTGCQYWKFSFDSYISNSLVYDEKEGFYAFAFDHDFLVYKIDLITGKRIWKKSLGKESEYDFATGSLSLDDSILIIPLSTVETAVAVNPAHPCCTSSGGVAAVNAKNGDLLWRHRVLPEAKRVGRVMPTFVKKYAPAGASVWNTPGIDKQSRSIFFGTGQSTQSPASEFSDAIIVLDLDTGQRKWATQTTSGDAHNVACEVPMNPNCPDEDGPDLDFGAGVIKEKNSKGEDVLLSGQKSGWIYSMNQDSGEIIWSTRVGRGGKLGGIHFGMATSKNLLFASNSDRYVASDESLYEWKPQPGLYALDIDTGEIKWAFKPDFICKRDNRQPLFGKGSCSDGFSAPPTVANDVIFVGSLNGQFYAVNSETGTKLWKYDTFKRYPDTVNKKPAVGGSIEAQGPVVSDSWVYTSSGYSINGHMTGNIFLAFSIE